MYNDKEYKCFNSLKDTMDFNESYMGDWMKDFMPNEKNRGLMTLSDCEYRYMRDTQGLEEADKFKSLVELNYILQCYSGYGFRDMNDWFRNHSLNSAYKISDGGARKIEELELHGTIVSNEISKFKLPYPIIAFRIVDSRGFMEKLKVGYTWRDSSFVSTGLVKDAITNKDGIYGDTLFKLYLPEGIGALYLDKLSNRDESELLLQRGLNFRIVSKITEEGYRQAFIVEVTAYNPSNVSKKKTSVVSKLMSLF